MSASENTDSESVSPKISITIPKSAYEPLQKLAHLDEVSFEKIVSALPAAGPGLSQRKFCERVSAMANGVNPSDVKAIVSEMFRMDYLRSQAEITAAELADVVADAADEVESEDFSLSEQEVALLRDRIARLFDSQGAIPLVSKANSLLMDHQHVFVRARLFSDVRPVFSEDAAKIDAAVLVHDLVIHYEENDEHMDFHVALDEADIKVLREILDRAEKKAASLKAVLSKAEIAHLAPNE